MFLGNLSSPENEPTPSKDKVEINFLRIANLLTTICPSAVRVYFDKQIPPQKYLTQKTLTYTFHYWEFFCPGGFCPRPVPDRTGLELKRFFILT
jgi:hypothetical protein